MKFFTTVSSALFAALTLANAGAATLNQTFMNDYATNALYFWADDAANLQFAQVSFGTGMTAWSVQQNGGDALVLAGPTVDARAGRFTVRFDYTTRPFSFQWAEVFFDSGLNRILGGGTLTYTTGGWVSSDVFTRAAAVPHPFAAQASVPLPQPALLLVSALLLLPLRQLRRARL
jgi:hypothetical protein